MLCKVGERYSNVSRLCKIVAKCLQGLFSFLWGLSRIHSKYFRPNVFYTERANMLNMLDKLVLCRNIIESMEIC